jgi:hypothetical protein
MMFAKSALHPAGAMAGRAFKRPPPPLPREVGTVIPYDLAATFKISGRPGNILQDVINVSTDSVFVAVGIGYGFEEDRERTIKPASDLAAGVKKLRPFGDLTLGDLPLPALIDGFRINPKYAHWVFPEQVVGGEPNLGESGVSEELTEDRLFGRLLQRIKPPEDISFLISLIDTATGREFQDQPAHNLAALGKSNGERPFRALAKPFTFAPRSTLRVQITERTEAVRGTLFVVLYGYRILGASSCPEPVVRQLKGSPLWPEETIGNPNVSTIPYDHVSSIRLTGQRGNLIETEMPVSADGGYVATSIGYGLAAERQDVKVNRAGLATPTFDLAKLALRSFPAEALLDGIRLKPGWMRVALQDGGNLAAAFQTGLLDQLFERINRPEDVSFRYAIHDTGTGRELQNQRLNNIAGLGIADGDRPFKSLPRAIVFLPRSTIRIEIEEQFGRGQLYIVFHGYKFRASQGDRR